MISIDAYRARVGMFQNGKIKQVGSSSRLDNILGKKRQFNTEPQIFLSKKQSCFFLLAGTILLSILCSELATEVNYQKPHISSSSEIVHETTENNCKETTVCSIMHASVLATQLIIGNVESNPGPMDLKEFLGFLYTDTEDVTVKEVLNDFKAAQDRSTNLKKMKSKKVENLKSTLAYLNDWDKDATIIRDEIETYTKDGIALLVVKKIYNMAPDKCSSCNKTYYFKPGDYCVLSCFRCNRGACKECYEKEKDKLNSNTMFNKSIFFSCTNCTETICTQEKEESNFKKKSAKNSKASTVPSETINLVEEVDNENPVDELADAISNLKLTKTDAEIPTVNTENINPDEKQDSSPKEHQTW